jgi:parvulin-like peptidyl-prolyl isomerase
MSLKLTLAASAIVLLVGQTAMAAEAGSEAGVSISDTELTNMFRENGYDIGQVPEPQVETNLKRALALRVIANNAKKAAFDKTPAVQAAMKQAAEDELVRRYVLSQSSPPASYPSDAEQRQAYENAKPKLVQPKRVRVADIYLTGVDDATQKRAKALDADLRLHPDGFPDAAAKNGGDITTATNGGDWIAMKNLPADFVAAIDPAPKGGVTTVIPDKTGFHIVRVIDRAEETTPTFDQVKGDLVRALREQKTRELTAAYFNQVVTQSPPNINLAVLARVSAPGTVPTAATAPGSAPAPAPASH